MHLLLLFSSPNSEFWNPQFRLTKLRCFQYRTHEIIWRYCIIFVLSTQSGLVLLGFLQFCHIFIFNWILIILDAAHWTTGLFGNNPSSLLPMRRVSIAAFPFHIIAKLDISKNNFDPPFSWKKNLVFRLKVLAKGWGAFWAILKLETLFPHYVSHMINSQTLPLVQ